MIESNPRIPFRLSTEAPPLPAPNGKPLIVHIVINLEHWPFDRPMPRSLFTATHGGQPVPDLPNFSWVEYGLRMGVPRIERILKDKGLPASAAMNASVIEVYPSVAELAIESKWEIIAHSIFQRSLKLEEDPKAVIEETSSRLKAFSGVKPRGWLGPGAFGETDDTPEHLKEAGFDHVYDWLFDDQPCWMKTKRGPLIAMPYALELNDVTIFTIERHGSDAYFTRFRDTVDALEPELATQPRVLTLGLHPHIIGAPHRLASLERTLEMLMKRNDTMFMTGNQIADWFIGACPPPAQ